METEIQRMAAQVHGDLGYYTVKTQGHEFQLMLLDTSTGFTTAQEIAKLLLPSLGAGADGVAERITDSLSDSKTFSDAAIYLTSQLQSVDTLDIIKTLLIDAKVDGAPLDFDTFFRGKYGILLEVVEAAIKENFEDFLMFRGLKERWTGFVSILTAPVETEETLNTSSEQ